MNLKLLFPGLFLLVSEVYSQSPPASIDTAIRAAISHDNNDRTSVLLTNTSHVPINAVVLRYKISDSSTNQSLSGTRYYDSTTEPGVSKPLLPDTTTVVWSLRGTPNAPITDVLVEAALMADHTTAGDPEWINRILQRRKYMVDALTASLKELNKALETKTTREQLKAQFQSNMNNELSAASSEEQRACINSVRKQVIAALDRVNQATDGTPLDISTIISEQIQGLTYRLAALPGSASTQLH